MSSNAEVTLAHNLKRYEDPKLAPIIEFIFADGSTSQAVVGTKIRGMRQNGLRPINLRWFNIPDGYEVTDKLREWLLNELQYVFDHRVNFLSNATYMLRLQYDS